MAKGKVGGARKPAPGAVAVPKKRGRPKAPGGPKPRTPIAVTIRAAEPWRDWMGLACGALRDKSGVARVDSTDVIDAALTTWAKEMGLDRPPPRF